jgi:hypothetical protein
MADVCGSEGVEHPQIGTRHLRRERELAALARRQYGAVGRDQLIRLGFSPEAIKHRLRAGRLQLVHPRVYAIGGQPLIQRGRWHAALLATPPSPALSHLSSLAARGLARERDGVHVTTAGPAKCLDGVTVHRSRTLTDVDVERPDDLPLTALPRTLLDVAATETFESLRTIAETIDRRELLDLRGIGAVIARTPGHHGIKPLRALLADYLPVDDPEEGLERDFQVLLVEEGLPTPERNVLVEGLLVDCWWPDHRFVVELDSRGFHSTWAAAERDRARDAKLLRAGIACLRVTRRRLVHQRAELTADLSARLPVELASSPSSSAIGSPPHP